MFELVLNLRLLVSNISSTLEQKSDELRLRSTGTASGRQCSVSAFVLLIDVESQVQEIRQALRPR